MITVQLLYSTLHKNLTNKLTLKNVSWLTSFNTYTMMLLMGMWMSLTKNPMKPMMANPIAVAMAIFWNSTRRQQSQVRECSIIKTLYPALLALIKIPVLL